MAAIIKPHRGAKTYMTTGSGKDVVLADGELFVELPDSGLSSGTARFKIGDGTSAYSALPYTFSSGGTVTKVKVGSTDYDPSSGVVTLPAYPTTLPASNTTNSYSASGTVPVSGTAVAAALGTLDVTGASGISAGKTISAWSETDGKVSISTQDISITKSQVSDFPTLGTAAAKDIPASGNATTVQVVMGNDTRLSDARTPVAHNQASSTINAMTGYSKPSSTSAIAATDSLNTAIGKLEKALDGKGSSSFSGNYNDLTNKPTLGTAAAKAFTTSVTSGSSDLVTSDAVYTAIDNLPEPMVFKGSLGTGGTITALPVNGTATIGDTYKVITAGTYASKAAKVGDTFICLTKTSNANTWELIPSGDEPSGTVTSVGISNGGGISVSGSPVTSSGTITVSHADTSSQTSVNNSGRTYIQDITLDDYGHVTGIASATETVTNTDRYVNSASFANDDTNSNVKMTLTRAGSDTATVTANIPKVSSSSAGVAPKGAAVSSQSQTTKFLREDGSWAAPSYTTNTWRGIQNNLTSDSTTDSLSAAQGKALANGSARDSTKLPLAGGTMTGNLEVKRSDTYANNTPAKITLTAYDTTNSRTSTGYIAAFDGGVNGAQFVINPCGNMFIGSGEAAAAHVGLKAHNEGEDFFLDSDSSVHIQANAQTIANRVGVMVNASGELIPEKADVATNNVGSIGNSTYKWANGYFTNINGVAVGTPKFTDTDTKVTAVGNHYAPAEDSSAILSADASSSTAATWNSTSLVTGVDIKRDAKGHVVGVAVDSIKMPANPNTNTTYTFANGTNGFTVTPSGGSAQTVTVTPSIANNITGSGTSGYIAKFNGTNTVTNGPAFGSTTTTYLNNAGNWATPPDTKNTAGSTDTSSKIFLVGATSQAANPQTYSDNEVYATNGVLTTKSVQVGGTAATIQYNSTNKCIDFVFA